MPMNFPSILHATQGLASRGHPIENPLDTRAQTYMGLANKGSTQGMLLPYK